MNIILLGHTGFVGRNIAELFTEKEISFIGLSRSNGLDLRDTSKTEEFLCKVKPKIIINCAAHVGSLNYVTQMAADVITDNVQMILSLYNAVAKKCPKAIIINPIANCAYPSNLAKYEEDNLWNGQLHPSVLSYGSSRRLLLNLATSFQMQYNIRSINLLVPNMYGPYDSTDPNKAHALNALISKFIKAKYEKQKKLIIWGTGIAIREWLYARDFAKIILHLINNINMVGLAEPVNIAQNFGLSVKELVSIIQKEFQFDGEIVWDHNMPDGAPKKVMDDVKFKKVFKSFSFTEMSKGIVNTIKYYNSIYPY